MNLFLESVLTFFTKLSLYATGTSAPEGGNAGTAVLAAGMAKGWKWKWKRNSENLSHQKFTGTFNDIPTYFISCLIICANFLNRKCLFFVLLYYTSLELLNILNGPCQKKEGSQVSLSLLNIQTLEFKLIFDVSRGVWVGIIQENICKKKTWISRCYYS